LRIIAGLGTDLSAENMEMYPEVLIRPEALTTRLATLLATISAPMTMSGSKYGLVEKS
jgi:hypothetical protein